MSELNAPEIRDGLVIDGLSKVYGAKRVVDRVSFSCEPGTVTAFLGPNGSGKSTTLRMIVGHSSRTAGSARFDGAEYRDLSAPGNTVGILLDASAQHPGRSVWETARLSAILTRADRVRTAACLEAVGLSKVHRKRVGALSLGMRQRLGLALALLGSPRFLLLDEPANGLDPEGIHWLAEFLSGFAAKGGTVLVSSHQLAQAQAMADEIVIIDRGVARSAPELVDQATEAVCVVRTGDDEAFRTQLVLAGFEILPGSDQNGIVVAGTCEEVGRQALSSRVPVVRLVERTAPSLEEAFLRSTSGEFAGLSGDSLLALTGRPLR